MIRLVSNASIKNCQVRSFSSLNSNSRKELFKELFPLATKIDPTSNSFIAIEPIEGTNVEGTIFTTNKKENLGSLFTKSSTSPIISKTRQRKTTEEKIMGLIDSEEDKIKIFDRVNMDANFSFDEDIDGDRSYQDFFNEFKNIDNINDNDNFEENDYNNLNSMKGEQQLKTKKMKYKKSDSLQEYLDHYIENYTNSNHMSFIITESQDASVGHIVDEIQSHIEYPIVSYSIKKSYDRTNCGKCISSFVSIMLNSEENDKSIDVNVYYKRFANFGLTLNGKRRHVIKSSGLKTIEININDEVDEKTIRKTFVDNYNSKCETSDFMKISMSEPVYNPFDLNPKKHRGYANITFQSHYEAIKAFEFSKKLLINDTVTYPNLSRYIFADNSASSLLLKGLQKKKSNQNKEIELMKKMIDIKEKVKSLEENLRSIRSLKSNNSLFNKIENLNNNNNNSNNIENINIFGNNNNNNNSNNIENTDNILSNNFGSSDTIEGNNFSQRRLKI